ncbi:MAG: outer membrane beta-barrel protein [Candidatus Omnitrophica bacterium]|nr:outer membrane beta-barrel protein [Candidatus Omnitrophota bacterium]
MKRNVFVMIAVCGLVLSGGPAFAQLDNPDLPDREGVKIGDVIVHGAFKATEELETNIYLANTKEKFDAITILNPSAGIEIPLQKNRISIDYDAAVFLYGKYTTENHVDQRARALAEINLTDYKIKVEDVLRDYTDRAADENSRRVARFSNKLRAGVSTQLNKFGFDVGYTNIIDAYGSKDDLVYQSITYGDRDRVYNIVDMSVSYRFWPKTSLFFETDLGFIHYFNSSIPPDSWYIEPVVGIKGRPTNKILANAKAGFRYQGYNKSEIYNDKDFVGFVANGGLDYFLTEDDTLNFGFERGVYESLYQNMNYYIANILSLDYTHKFTKKFSCRAFGSYQLNTYPGQTVESGLYAKRYDNFYTGGASIRYDVRKWLSLEGKYEYEQRSSKFSAYDYTDNRIFFSGTGGF